MQQVKNGTTIHLTLPDPRRLWHLPTPAAAAIVTFALIAIAALVGRIQQAPAAAPAIAPTAPLPVVVIQKEQPAAPAPVQVVAQQPAAPAAPQRWVTAFAAPNGAVLGPIPEPALSAILGRFGDGWLMTTWQGSAVWVRVSELGGNLANVAPAPATAPQQPVYVAPAVEPVYQTTSEQPPAAPEPPQQPAQQPAIVVPAPAVQAAPAPAQQDGAPIPADTAAEWARQQWQSEHCTAGVCR